MMQFPQIQGWILLSILLIGNPLGAAPGYIGAKQCGACHQAEYQDWQGSHHDLAMQSASEDSMLGNFDNSEFSHFNQVTRFYRKGDQYWVNTDGPNGKPADFQILYAFGVYPLQQYLVAFPGGRLQALDIAWDSRLEKEGGQRWMHLHPDQEITHEDVLHWTGPNLNWNYMCADCHSTNLLKNYDTEKQRYRTTWSEMNVACEACHGPGSAHLQWAKSDEASKSNFSNKGLTTNLTERQGVTWAQTGAGTPVRSVANQQRREIEICAVCHSRRSQLTDAHNPGDSFLDGFHPSLLDQGLYHADGQMQDEVYVWGSFLQSKMFQAGVTCSDCHDPHKAELRLPGEQVCYQCHKPEQYATPVHHHHQQDSAGSSCVECHMPPVTFMQVDARHDHGFRIPRPDQSQQMGTPNACSKCHQEQSPDWAVARLKDWYGEPDQGYQLFAPLIHSAWENDPSAAGYLLQLAMDETQPAIARATAMSLWAPGSNRAGMLRLQQILNDDDPLVRLGALEAASQLPVQQRIIAFPLVWDELLAVRTQAARLMASYPESQIPEKHREQLRTVLDEYIATQAFSAERPESQLNLASLYNDLGQQDKAEAAFKQALVLQPQFVPAYVNYAHMLGRAGREKNAEQILQKGIRKVPGSAPLWHALGLSQVRNGSTADALISLKKAATLDSDDSRYAYVYAVALHSTGKTEASIKALEAAIALHPSNIEILMALVNYNRQSEQYSQALKYVKKLETLLPGHEQVKALRVEIESLAKQPIQ